jgi:predicted RNA-binding Zn ribbon-like protein
MRRQLFFLVVLVLAAVPTVSLAQDAISFSRQVAAVFSKLGCNGGACHGAVKGQNGFRLTLFGADPALDHERLLREIGGRRLNFNDPVNSLLLLKATGQISHGGGKRMEIGSAEYELLRRWIASGAPIENVEQSRLKKLTITPAQYTAKPGESFRLKVEASFADGSKADVTTLCSFESMDRVVALVERDGQVHVKAAGDAALIARFRTEPAVAVVVAPRVGKEAFPDVKPQNYIDQHIHAKLRRLNIPPAPLAEDVTFLRRACLDVTGELPSPEEIRRFLDDKAPDKRTRKIDELLKRPGHAAVWTLKFCDILNANDYGVYADGMSQEQDAPRFQQWIRARLEENTPYDQFVERILTATSREGRSLDEWAKEVIAVNDGYATPRTDIDLYSKRKTLDLYWQRRASAGVSGTLQVAHAFLGLRLECAQCHRHPHDTWQQDDLLSFANFFMHVRQPGFQGDNEKKFPEQAAFVKTLNSEAKKLADEAKKMRETIGKKLDADAKATKSKEAQEALAKFQKEVGALERRAKAMPEYGRRIMHAEVQHLTSGKDRVAKVTSPLGSQESRTYRLLGEARNVDVPKDQDPRGLVIAWMRRPDNPFFAKAIVNRVWAHYFGRGIIDPPDHLSPLNPPTHPELLDELCQGFIKNNYDLRWLHRTILNSRTYQQSSESSAENRTDRSNYAFFYLRRLPAEVLVDALNHATGVGEDMEMKFYHWRPDWKTVEIPYAPKNAFVTFMLEQFGRPQRNSGVQCDCERDSNASVLQVLSLANHPRIRQKIADDKGHVARILKAHTDDGRRLDEIFLVALCRLPSDAERQACASYIRESASPAEGYRGVMWSLLNTREFLLQH